MQQDGKLIMKNSKKIKYYNSYEEDLICMSYRYCIGRHTISAHMHANNIIKNSYNLIKPESREFMSKDILKIITGILGIPFEDYIKENSIDTDILVWYETAICLNSKAHEFCNVRNDETGEVTNTEYFWSYRKTNWEGNNYEKVRISFNEYLKNPCSLVYIKLDDIINDGKDVSNLPLKRKKQKTPKNIDLDVLDSI